MRVLERNISNQTRMKVINKGASKIYLGPIFY